MKESNLLDITYKDYSGDYECVTDEICQSYYHGRILGIRSVITYEADTLEQLKKEFKQSVDDYIEFCSELNLAVETPVTYLDLITKYAPKPIKNEQDLDEVQVVVYALLDNNNHTTDEKDYLNVLLLLVEQYESINHPIPDVSGVDMIKHLLEVNGLKQKDLVYIFKTSSIVSEVLSGKRSLTARHIQELALRFNVSPSVFFPIK